jgi:stage V sporulation protein AD
MKKMKGKQSIEFEQPPYLLSWASVAAKKEGEGPLGDRFDQVMEDPLFGEKTWEMAEGRFMKQAAMLAISKAQLQKSDIRYAFAGDLLEQNTATSYGIRDLELPLFGLFGACSTVGEALSLAAITVAGGFAHHVLAAASSHIGSAEKQFRFPLEYGNQRPLSATWTVTGSGGFIVSEKKSAIKIRGITTGKIVDYGMKDPMNMGACMAPAAAQVIYQHFQDYNTGPKDYDAIYTGDLGAVGKELAIKLMKDNGYDIFDVYGDCGLEIYENEEQDTHSGGSGCACSALVLAALLTEKLIRGKWKRLLFVPTGALMSKTSFNEGESVKGIAHGILLEREERA